MPDSEFSKETILKILQFEGRERLNVDEVHSRIDLGAKIIAALDLERTPPAEAILTMTSLLGFLATALAKSEEAHRIVILKICFDLMANSKITLAEIEEGHAKLKEAGIIK